jgi:hypothetical protein
VTGGRPVRFVVALATAALVASAVYLRPFVLPAAEPPLREGPVVALGGSPSRVEVAAAIVDRSAAERVLILSHPPQGEQAPGGRCADPGVRCIWPRPVSTWGEVQAIARLAAEGGWPGVTVVTDDFHLPRSRSLLRRCVAPPVHVVGTGATGRVPLNRAVHEAAATLVSTVAYRGCR